MTFNLKKIPDVAIDVPIMVPGDKGKTTNSTITVRYRLLPVSETQAIFSGNDNEKITDDALLARDIVDITGIKDEDGKPLEYSTELLTDLMELNYVRPALVQGWLDVQGNRAAAVEKN